MVHPSHEHRHTLRVHLHKLTNVPPLLSTSEGRGVHKWGGGKRDPYVLFTLSVNDDSASNTERKSAAVPRTLNPTWSPPAVFDFSVVQAKTLHLHVTVHDDLHGDAVLASALIDVEAVESSQVQSYRLSPQIPQRQAKCHIWLDIESVCPSSNQPLDERTRWEYQRRLESGATWEALDHVEGILSDGSLQNDHQSIDDDGWAYAASIEGPWTLHEANIRRRRLTRDTEANNLDS